MGALLSAAYHNPLVYRRPAWHRSDLGNNLYIGGACFSFYSQYNKDGDLEKTVQWSTMFFIVTAVVIGKAMYSTGAATIIAKTIFLVVTPEDLYVLVLLIGVGTVFGHILA